MNISMNIPIYSYFAYLLITPQLYFGQFNARSAVGGFHGLAGRVCGRVAIFTDAFGRVYGRVAIFICPRARPFSACVALIIRGPPDGQNPGSPRHKETNIVGGKNNIRKRVISS